MIRKIILSLSFIIISIYASAQYTYGTTGLLNMPTADMQKDKTFLFGGGYLEKHATPTRWFYDTYNYYVNITIFPWMEFAYTCTLHKSLKYDPALINGYWVPYTYGKFVNQDRNFSVRFRLWKEGWWKPWTPQIVIGGNDVVGDSWNGGSLTNPTYNQGNGFYNRYYLAATKHIGLQNLGNLGLHVSYIYNKRKDYKLRGLCIGANFRFNLKDNKSMLNKAINGLNIMVEAYPADGNGMNYVDLNMKHNDRGVSIGKYDINIGACYSLWKDHINFYAEMYGCKDFSAGLQFNISLK